MPGDRVIHEEMKLLAQIDETYIFQLRKKEDTGTAIERIRDIIKHDLHYIGITSATDIRLNGRAALLDKLAELPDFTKFNIILAWKQ